MKCLILMLCLFTAVVATAEPSRVPEKVLVSFKNAFPNVTEVKWGETKSFYDAYFTESNKRCRIRFDEQGELKYIIKYYLSDQLCPFMKEKLQAAYPDAEIFGITEVTTNNRQNYEIVLKDEKNWIKLQADASGNLTRLKKFRQA